MVNYHAGFPALPAPRRQISGYPPAFGSIITLTRIPPCRLFFVVSSLSPLPCRFFLVASSLSSHLAHFVARPINYSCLRFAGSWIVGFVAKATKWPTALSYAVGPSY